MTTSSVRAVVLALSAALALACGSEPAAPPEPSAAPVDRSAAELPAGVLVELSFDGGDAGLAALIARLPPTPLRAGIPSRVSTLLEGLIDTPLEIGTHVAASSPLRVLMVRLDGEVHSVVAVRLDAPIPASARAIGAGPRGADRVGTRAAVDDQIAVVSDDAATLDRTFAYLAYVALARPSTEGAIVAHAPASTLATTLRTGLEEAVAERRARLLASVAAARAAHDRPPDFGDPEVIVTHVADALLARIAYLPDLGDATITLAPTSSGLALSAEAPITEGSPLAVALQDRTRVGAALAAAMPTSAALVVATGASAEARAGASLELAELLGDVGGARVGEAERASLAELSRGITALRGDEGALALGASDDEGAYVLTLTQPGTDAPAPALWGRSLPWLSQVLGAIAGCTPVAPRASAEGTPLCGDTLLATRAREGARADALARDAGALAESSRAALVARASAPSPDLARDLGALPSSSFAILLLRPLRALPLLVALGGPPRAGLPRGDGALVLALARPEPTRLRVELRASTAAMADLDALGRLFAEPAESE